MDVQGRLRPGSSIAGRHDEAIKWADQVLREDPIATHVVGFKAVACIRLGGVEKARE